MRLAAEPMGVSVSHVPELGVISEPKVGERELKALPVPLAYGGQAATYLCWAIDSHDSDLHSGDRRDLSDDERLLCSRQEPGQLLLVVVTVDRQLLDQSVELRGARRCSRCSSAVEIGDEPKPPCLVLNLVRERPRVERDAVHGHHPGKRVLLEHFAAGQIGFVPGEPEE